jgi:hypothetical protein
MHIDISCAQAYTTKQFQVDGESLWHGDLIRSRRTQVNQGEHCGNCIAVNRITPFGKHQVSSFIATNVDTDISFAQAGTTEELGVHWGGQYQQERRRSRTPQKECEEQSNSCATQRNCLETPTIVHIASELRDLYNHHGTNRSINLE